jgi:GT2 family glycosyltransferase
LLNSDAVIEPDCLVKLISILDARPEVGLVAPAVCIEDGTVQDGSYGSFPTPATIFLRANGLLADTRTPDWISGTAVLVRRDDYMRLGGFDEGFFMYHEDIDLCRRFRQAGLIAYREPSAVVVHLGGCSSPSNRAKRAAYDASQDRYLAVSGVSRFGRAAVRIARGIYRGLSVRPSSSQ